MSKTPFLILHLIGLCLAIGPVVILDVRLFQLITGRPVNRLDIDLVAVLSRWIRVGLGLLWFSGVGFILFYALNTPELLANPKLHAKLVAVGILTLNGLAVERYAFAQLAAREGQLLLDPDRRGQRLRLLAIGAVSATSWYTPLLLGAVRELNFACAAWLMLALYALSIAGAFLCLAAIARLSRPGQDGGTDRGAASGTVQPLLQTSPDLGALA